MTAHISLRSSENLHQVFNYRLHSCCNTKSILSAILETAMHNSYNDKQNIAQTQQKSAFF